MRKSEAAPPDRPASFETRRSFTPLRRVFLLNGDTMASILPFPVRRGPWSPQELSSLANIRREFIEQGLKTSAQHGVTDEGDAWTVFCEGPTGSPMAHIARVYPTNV